jgi:hypothetical protein
MRSITFDEYLAASGLDVQKLKLLRRRDQIAGAFGRRECWKGLGFIELDCVAPMLVDALASVFVKEFAAQLVRVHADQWSIAVAKADAEPEAPVFFTIVEFLNPGGKRHHVACLTTTDDPYQIVTDASKATGQPAVRSVAVNIRGVLEDVRRNARRAKIDFKAPFLPAPGPELDALLAPYVEERDKAIDIAVKARRAGIKARALVEASIPERLQ